MSHDKEAPRRTSVANHLLSRVKRPLGRGSPSRDSHTGNPGSPALIAGRLPGMPVLWFALLATLCLGLLFAMNNGLARAQDDAIEYPENSKDVVATFTAEDPERATSITWGLLDPDNPPSPLPSGIAAADFADFSDFEIDDEDGILEFANPPDFENPTGSNSVNTACDVTADPNPCTNTYKVVVTATDPHPTDPKTGYHKVTVKVINENEIGDVTWTVDPDGAGPLSASAVNGGDPIMQFQVGATLTASVTDGDIAGTGANKDVTTASGLSPARASAPIWRWYRSPTKTAAGTEIDNANSAAYIVGLEDVGMYLRVVAHYVVAGNVAQETASLTSDYIVLAARVGEHELEFAPATLDRSVAEGKKGAKVGTPVTATGNHGEVNYVLTGTDASLFKIDPKTGQISTAFDLDYEGEATATATDSGSCAEAASGSPDRECTVTVTATDASGEATSTAATNLDATVTINITDVDEKPTFNDGDMAVSVAENSKEVRADSDTDGDNDGDDTPNPYTASDPEGRSLTYHLMGADGAKFDLSSTRNLSFKVKPNYEVRTDANRDNVYEVTVRASDGTMHTDRKVRVTVTGVEEAPEVIGKDSFNYEENGEGAVATFTADDPEGGTSITWSIPTGDPPGSLTADDNEDSALFTIDPEDGELEFASSPDFEASTIGDGGGDADQDNTYHVVVAATDAATTPQVGYHKVTVTVINVNEMGDVTWTVDPDGAGPLIASAVNGGDPIMQFQVGATLTASATDGDIAGNDKAVEVGDEEATWRWYRGSAEISGETDNIYTVQVGDAPSRLRVEVSYRVGDSTTKEKASLTSDYIVLAARTGGHELEFDPATLDRSVAEGKKGAKVGAPVTATGNHGEVNYVLTGTDASLFKIDPKTGQISTAFDLDYEGETIATATDSGSCADAASGSPDRECTVTVTATDASGEATSTAATNLDATVTINITDVDEKPTFSTTTPAIGTTALSVAEGNTALTTVADVANVTYAATDQDGLNVNLTLMGVDSAKFTLSAGTNGSVLSFSSKLDYEVPTDANRDNVYDVTVRASDGTMHTDRKVRVTVTDVNEAPEIMGGAGPTVRGPSGVSYAEDRTDSVATYTATGFDGAVSWSLTGADRGDFNISSGVLTFRSAPNYERPADANTDNTYEVTVTARRGTDSDSRDVRVTVTDVEETTTGDPLVDRYDVDGDGIEKSEVIAAIRNYRADPTDTSKADVIRLIRLYRQAQ